MRNSIVTCTNNKNSSSWNISQARTLLLLLITLLAFNDMVTNKSILTTVILISYWSYAMAWLSLIRTYPIEGQANKRAANATKLIHQSKHSQTSTCRKDKHCQQTQFCNRYEKMCVTCREVGQTCRRNKMCCRGMECANGKCRHKVKLAIAGALCTKDRDCNYGYCCAREKGQSVCKRMLQKGDRCKIPNGMYLWSHQCPCAYGLKCRKKRRASENLLDLLKDWNDESERRCVRSSYINT